MPNVQLHIDIVCAVPDAFGDFLSTSIVGRGLAKGLVEIEIHDIHDYANDSFKHIDDTPYGGGAGMVLKCDPIFKCIEAILETRPVDEVIFLCPDGERLEQNTCNELSTKRNLILLAGHYKGIDQRIRDVLVTREISIGDYVLTGGEIASAVLADAIVRLVPGVVSDAESVLEDSFMHGTLDAPLYTKPATYRGHSVPEILLSGDHAKIAAWRTEQALEKTAKRRPDLLGPDGDES